MSFLSAYTYLTSRGMSDRVLQFQVSSATVELAAQAVGCSPEKIAKSLTFKVAETTVMIICAGDAKIANSKYKAFFGTKAKMLSPAEVSSLIGHDVGGVCPFGIRDGVKVYLDISLKRFDTVYPACGNAQSAVRLAPAELEVLASSSGWIDVCSVPENMPSSEVSPDFRKGLT